LKAFVAAGLEIGPDMGEDDNNKIFRMNALGALVINADGIAADVNVSVAIGGAISDVVQLEANARLVFNTTEDNQDITIPEKYVKFLVGESDIPDSLDFDVEQVDGLTVARADLATRFPGLLLDTTDGSATYRIPGGAPLADGSIDTFGKYVLVTFDANLIVLNLFEIDAGFRVLLSGDRFEIGFGGKLRLGGFGQFDITAGAVIDSNGFAAYGQFGININLGGVVGFGGTATLQINTGSDPGGVNVPTGATTSVNVSPNTAKVSVTSKLTLFGIETVSADLEIGIENRLFKVAINNLDINLFVLTFNVNGFIRSDGQFSLTGSVSLPSSLLGSTWGIYGGISVTIDNSGFKGSGEIGIRVLGEDFNIASATLSVTKDEIYIRAEGPLSVWISVTINSSGVHFDGGLGFFDAAIEFLEDVGKAIAEGVTAAVDAIGKALDELGSALLAAGEAILDFAKDFADGVVNLVKDIGKAIGNLFKSSRTIVEKKDIDPEDYLSYSTSLTNGVLTINMNGGRLTDVDPEILLAKVGDQLIIDGPNDVENVTVAVKKKQKRKWDWYKWGPWRTTSTENIKRDIEFPNTIAYDWDDITSIVIIGTGDDDKIVMDKGNLALNKPVVVYGNDGNDLIVTANGNDTVYGGNGDDTIFTYGGNDTIYGDNQAETQFGNDVMSGGAGNDSLYGGRGEDVLDESQDRGDDPASVIINNEFNTLDGGAGNDIVLGSPGKDTIIGGSGDDYITGYNNDDTFKFDDGYGIDTFFDFDGKTVLDFSQVNANLDVTVSDAGFRAITGDGSQHNLFIANFIGISQLPEIDPLTGLETGNLKYPDFQIAEVEIGAGNDDVLVTALPGYLIKFVDNGGNDTYDFDLEKADTDKFARADVTDNSGSPDRIELDINSTGHTIYLHPQAVLLNQLNLTFNTGVEQLYITDNNPTKTWVGTKSGSGFEDLLIKTGVTIKSVPGKEIELRARDDFIFQSGALIETDTDVSKVIIRADQDSDSEGATIDLFGTIKADEVEVYGNSQGDTVNVGNVQSGVETTIWTYGGTDTINVQSINEVTTVYAGSDTDTINVGSTAPSTGGNVNGIVAELIIRGQGGSDTLNVYDKDTGNEIGNLTRTDLTGLDLGVGIKYSVGTDTVENVNIYLGNRTDTFTIESTNAATTTNVYTGDVNANIVNVRTIDGATNIIGGNGSDTVNVGSNANGVAGGNANDNSGGTLNDIDALLTINGNDPATGSDVLNVDDTGDDDPNTGILTPTTITGLGMASGIVYGTIEHLNIALGDGGNTFTINGTHGSSSGGYAGYQNTTDVSTGDGADLITINNVTDTLTVNGQGGNDTFNVNGTGVYSTSNLNGQAGNDSFHIRANAGEVYVAGGANDDNIYVTNANEALPGAIPDLPDTNVRTAPTGSVDLIDALLDVDGGNGTDQMYVDGSDAPVQGRSATLTPTTLNGMGLSSQGIVYANLAGLTIWMDGGANTMTVNDTHATNTSIYMSGGTDTVDVNDSSGILTVYGEEAADVFNVLATNPGSTLNLRGNEDTDTFNISDTAPTRPQFGDYPVGAGPPGTDDYASTPLVAQKHGTVDAIDGLVDIDGGSEADQLNIDDSANTSAKRGTLTSNTLRGMEMLKGVNYTNLEDLNLWLGTKSDTLYVVSTHDGTTQIYGGDGVTGIADNDTGTPKRDDTIAINTIGGITTVYGQGGNDLMLVNVEEATPGGEFVRTHQNGISSTEYVLNLTGNGGSDEYVVNLSGLGEAVINVHDYGTPNDGVDRLTINGADDPAAADPGDNDDTFLLRKDFVALLNKSASSTEFDQVERVNYDQNINDRLVVNGLRGDDRFVADDNSATTTLDGGDGEDSFQIGQIFATLRTAESANIATGDEFDTTRVIIGIIRDPDTNAVVFDPSADTLDADTIQEIESHIDPITGYLAGIAYVSDGVSQPTTVYGGDGNDTFSVYQNKGTLRLEGEANNDTFIVRAFVLLPTVTDT
ncbi:MAG: beta strand repeat-containing protein, partial [Planctomycetota bacterium]